MTADHVKFSRCQILCAEREAWNDGEGAGDGYHYDGMCFWRLEKDGKRRLLPSWRTPSHGWSHEDGCDCDLCGSRRPIPLRPRSVA